MTRWTIIAAVVIEGLSEYAKTAFAATENERTAMGMAECIAEAVERNSEVSK